jgi:hypothetical protein
VAVQIVLQGDIEVETQGRIERLLNLQLGSVLSRFVSLKAVVSKHHGENAVPYQCELFATLKNGSRLEVTMLNSGVHVCVADAAARLLREVRRYTRTSDRSLPDMDLQTGF